MSEDLRQYAGSPAHAAALNYLRQRRDVELRAMVDGPAAELPHRQYAVQMLEAMLKELSAPAKETRKRFNGGYTEA